MPFFLVLPLIVIGIVIAFSKKAAEQNKRAEAQRRAAQAQTEQVETEGQASYAPVKPSVQVPPVRKAEAAPKSTPTVQKAYQSSFAKPDKKMHPEHEFCALRPEDETAKNPSHASEHVSKRQSPESALLFTPDQIRNGVILSEILGKPKALR